MAAKSRKLRKARDQDDEFEHNATGIIIQINAGWRLTWDGLQFIVQKAQLRKSGKHAGETNWIAQAYICDLDTCCVWLARKQIYAIAGTYGIEGIDKLGAALDVIKAETRESVKAGLAALERSQQEQLAAMAGEKESASARSQLN